MAGSPIISKDSYAHSCDVTGAIWGSQGRTFDGSDDRIAVASNVTKGKTALTFLAWIKPTDISTWHCVCGDNAATLTDMSSALEIKDIAATSTWESYSTLLGENVAYTTLLGTTTLNPYGQWALVGFTWDAITLINYLNGVADGSKAYVDTQLKIAVTQNTVIGALKNASGSENFNGLIGEVLIYSRTLAPLEIQHIYLATKWRYR